MSAWPFTRQGRGSNTVVATVPAGTGPNGVAVHPAGTRVYVADFDIGKVSVIDTTSNTVLATVPVGTNPNGVAVHPAGTRIYVANQGSNSVSVIDTATHTVIATVPVGSHPRAFGQFIGPALPTLTLTLTGCTNCKAGDTFSVNVTVRNPALKPVSVEVKAGVVLPDGTKFNIWVVNDKHFEFSMPTGFDVTGEILHGTLPNTLPKGVWVYEAGLIDPELGRTLARDAKTFTRQ
ncbi:MAG: YncE family protein [Nitrospinae bacterium]|nr:YncE family protein [Nitrospinota bacterium]